MKRSSFLTRLLLGFYLFYSLCPLLYSVGAARAEEGKESRWQIEETFEPAATAREQTRVGSEASSDSAQVLLIKKRAISPTSKGIVGKLTFCPVRNSFDAGSKTLMPPVTGKATTCPGGFQFYHSGISPPPV